MGDVWSRLVAKLGWQPTHDVSVFMKSGNRIRLDRVITCTWKYSGNEITSIRWQQHKRARTRLLVQSLALDQIEMIVEHR